MLFLLVCLWWCCGDNIVMTLVNGLMTEILSGVGDDDMVVMMVRLMEVMEMLAC